MQTPHVTSPEHLPGNSYLSIQFASFSVVGFGVGLIGLLPELLCHAFSSPQLLLLRYPAVHPRRPPLWLPTSESCLLSVTWWLSLTEWLSLAWWLSLTHLMSPCLTSSCLLLLHCCSSMAVGPLKEYGVHLVLGIVRVVSMVEVRNCAQPCLLSLLT